MSIKSLKDRTQQLGVDVILECEKSLGNSEAERIIKRQLIRCSTSVGANYRSASRGKSGKDFINKLKIVEEEADETMYWIEVVNKAKRKDGIVLFSDEYKEANELLSITIASIKTARKSLKSKNDSDSNS